MEGNIRRSSHWLVIIALVVPLVVVGALVPNFKQFNAIASRNSKAPLALTSSPRNLQAFTSPLAIPPVLTGSNIILEAREADVQILDGAPTRMWTYNGMFPGPTIRRTTGQTTRIKLANNLPSAGSLTLHHHGAHTTSASDGQPTSYLIPPNSEYTYTYKGIEENANERGAMHWYHDHMMDMTGHNVWMGLAGMYIVDDPADPQTLPSGEYDVPIMLMDRAFDENNQLIYEFDQNGVQGDTLLVNGVIQPYFEVASRKYRFRVLNASNFSDMDLELSNGQGSQAHMIQLGTESGLLPAPVSRQRILLGPAERADIVIDFTGQLDQNIVLHNRAGKFPGTTEIMQFRVTSNAPDDSIVPDTLRPMPDLGKPVTTRRFAFGHTDGHWTINGQTFDEDRVDAHPVIGTTETWVLQNTGDEHHVIHIHLTNQQLISRNGMTPGRFELMKESWYLNPGETVEVMLKFSDYRGRFVFHCHLLEHEDDSMMGQFEVVTSPLTPGPTQIVTATATSTPTLIPTSTPTPAATTTCASPTPTTVGVSIVSFAFNPQNVTISRGSTVRWTNTANRSHTSASDGGLWDSGTIPRGGTFTFTFNTAGSFAYHCNIHPNMRATINVVAPVCPTNTRTPTPTGTPILR